jgi:alanine racemase
MRALNILRQWSRKVMPNKEGGHLLRIEINADNLLHNIKELKNRFPNKKLSVVLKSNAYGHGLKEMALFLDKNQDIAYFVVDSFMEAKLLRDIGIKKELIILGHVLESLFGQLRKMKNKVLAINSLKQAEIFNKKIDFSLRVHIKVDTGMHRHGVLLNQLKETINTLKNNKNIKIEGLLTHLADADNNNSDFTLKQLQNWKEALSIYKKHFSSGTFHFSATTGTSYLDKAESNLVRVGAALYGFDVTKDKKLNLKPILSWVAKVVNIKDLKKGEVIGYNCTFQAERDMKIALVPCGYFEGVPRTSSNKGHMYFKNKPLKILGRVSMNLTALDVSGMDIDLEDEIEVFSDNSQRLNSVENYAKICETSIHDILAQLAPTIKRVVHPVK